jgi:hypothetical protein
MVRYVYEYFANYWWISPQSLYSTYIHTTADGYDSLKRKLGDHCVIIVSYIFPSFTIYFLCPLAIGLSFGDPLPKVSWNLWQVCVSSKRIRKTFWPCTISIHRVAKNIGQYEPKQFGKLSEDLIDTLSQFSREFEQRWHFQPFFLEAPQLLCFFLGISNTSMYCTALEHLKSMYISREIIIN